ncbi:MULTISPECIES: hypothetical protein [Pseudomonas]|uniref:Secreted protein n=1 Tax=Pseudomonas kuykendallii TaxID=1007099 RepID=A0A2W5D1J4_9PSED|nr:MULTISPECIES: hypothetical protein [Pseudomonas]MCQ4271175.1 hypothetical protein [Pseudomonas kuykendallii]PZP23217.1 MAG: hypothetical protein DI599_12605 [Pseudomonas kuykendallii]SDW68411.1 hypothetical protein SAMN05216287_1262 [Pseudomonas kuykendallii]
MRYSLLLLCCLGVAGCAGGGSPSACEVFSPPPSESPTSRDDQRVEVASSGDPTLSSDASEQDCP